VTAPSNLTAELRAEVSQLEEDLRDRVAGQPDVDQAWGAEYQHALEAGRTSASWEEWSGDRITQAAVAWVLITVFVRFAEDNNLVKPVWISGPAHRRDEAFAAQAEFLRETSRINPDVTDREWLQQAIVYLAELPATQQLVDETSALWLVTPSGDAVSRLLSFWRRRDDHGKLLHDLSDEELDTRFLGDLYQNLSEEAQKRYALKQTPVFVEEFILGRTLEPALAQRPLDGFKLIDPACGSGHFLLSAFARLLDCWQSEEPALDAWSRVQKALDAIHGVDLNPFAIAIARFRLTVAALLAGNVSRLEDAPAFKYHLAVGDSLLHGLDQQELNFGAEFAIDRTAASFTYATENLASLAKILQSGQYDVVVGNPPYITVKDKALNSEYRRRYNYCKGTYSLTVPFMERLFSLAKTGHDAGWVGQITSNSFMKREFGAPLIEKFFPSKDLTLVIDSAGAWLPGHNFDGTPTVILIGRNRSPVSSKVRVLLGVGDEPGQPKDPAAGKVWNAISTHVDDLGYSDDWVTIADFGRAQLAAHPWSLAGGGAVELKQAIEKSSARPLSKSVELPVGRAIRAGSDDAFMRPRALSVTGVLPTNDLRVLIVGNELRDWLSRPSSVIWYPYKYGTSTPIDRGISRELWALRSFLAARKTFQGVMADSGLAWWEYMQHTSSPYTRPLSIAYAEVATHNHFVLDRGGKVFNRTAPVIKLPKGSSEDDHLALLGLLNSSTVGFWLRQVAQKKGGDADQPWARTHQFNATKVADIPLPSLLPLNKGKIIEGLAESLSAEMPEAILSGGALPARADLDAARSRHDCLRGAIIAQQEELDWATYRLYGLIDEDLTYPGDDLPGLASEQRAFAIILARDLAQGRLKTDWFSERTHRFTPVVAVPEYWPVAYRNLVNRRIELIQSHPYLRLLEKPEYKRRWASEPWEKQEERALRSWLLDQLGAERFWFDPVGRPTPRSVAHLADDVARDPDLVSVFALWERRPDVPIVSSLQRLLQDEAVPYLAAYRHTDSGLRTRASWERTWRLQRREDAGEQVGPIPIPLKYGDKDFTCKEYWALRGRLDVPKERFILYPDAGRDTDPTPVVGWAGWDYAQQSLALAQLVQSRENDGWSDDRLVPLVAGLSEVQPWVEQWHTDADPFYGGVSPAEFFREQLDLLARQVGKTHEQLAAWRPTPTHRGGRPRKATS
jgi:hypothetical protein